MIFLIHSGNILKQTIFVNNVNKLYRTQTYFVIEEINNRYCPYPIRRQHIVSIDALDRNKSPKNSMLELRISMKINSQN